MTPTQASTLNILVCMIGLGFVLARRPQSQWALSFVFVLGLMFIEQVVRLAVGDAGKDSVPVVLIGLTTSALSTGVLAWLAMYLIGTNSLSARLGFASVASGQVISTGVGFARHLNLDHFSNMSEGNIAVLQGLDSATCLLAGIMFAIGLSRHFENKHVSLAVFCAPILWGVGSLLFWIDFPTGSIELKITRIALIGGVAATSIFVGVLSLRQPPGDEMPKPPLAA